MEKGEKLIQLIEQKMDRQKEDPDEIPETKLTWEEYQEDISNLTKSTEKQIRAVISDIESDNSLGRLAKDGWKIVPFLSSRMVKDKERSEENIETYGYLTYIILNNEGNIVHSKGSGKIADILPEELLQNAAIIEIPEINGMKFKLDSVSIKEGNTLENSLRNCVI